MGADDEGDKFASLLEKPRHKVSIPKPFALAAAPTTFEQWDFYSAETGARRSRDFGHGRGTLPVIDVSWDDAVGYVEWLSNRTGKPYRLPSEAEWEYACRAGTTSVFNTGPTLSIERANYLYTDVRQRPGQGRPVPVASYPPNGFGLYDMHGNVCELVADAWHDSYADAPADGSAWCDPASGLRVVRNGGWDAMPRLLRCAYRDWIDPTARYDNVGFRVACDG
jgi:formylglycine-generating enzyme required for sulfatase activity